MAWIPGARSQPSETRVYLYGPFPANAHPPGLGLSCPHPDTDHPARWVRSSAPRPWMWGCRLHSKCSKGGHVAPHGGRAAPLAAGARLIAAPTPRRRHLTQRGASRRRRQNRRELAARPRQQKHQPSTSPSLLVSSRLVAGAHARDVRSYRRVRSAKDDSNREPVGAAAARGGKTHDAHLMEMLRLWHLLI